jgi:hypothetical protein
MGEHRLGGGRAGFERTGRYGLYVRGVEYVLGFPALCMVLAECMFGFKCATQHKAIKRREG